MNSTYKILIITYLLLLNNFVLLPSSFSQIVCQGDIITGGEFSSKFTNNINFREFLKEINATINAGYQISIKSNVGLRFSLILDNEKSKEHYTNSNTLMSSLFYKYQVTSSLFIEAYTGFGRYHFNSRDISNGSGYNLHFISQFGGGIGYYILISDNLILLPCFRYSYETHFVDYLDKFSNNTNENIIQLSIGLLYLFKKT